MAFRELVLNLFITPFLTVTLLILLPPLTVLKALNWFWAWLTPENVRNKVVLITGASSGIGEHIVYEYAKKGARLVLMARREEQLQIVANNAVKHGAADVHIVVGNVTSEDDCKMAVEAAVQKYGQLNHLVNNAGVVNSFLFRDSDLKGLHTTVDTDFWGPIQMTHFALPYLRQAHGRVMLLSSVGAWFPLAREGIYNGAKAGVLQFFDTLRVEENDSLASVTIVMPGLTESEATGGKLVDEKGGMVQDTQRRDAQWGVQPMAYASTVAKASVDATLRGYRYVVTPYFYSPLLLWRIFAPEVLDKIFYAQGAKDAAKPANKKIVEATNAHKAGYVGDTVKEE